jgi:hypothetical protein
MKVLLGDFAPDVDPVAPGFMRGQIPNGVQMPLLDTNWIYSTPAGFRSMPQLQVLTTALPSAALGAFSAQLANGLNFVVLGIANQLYIVTFFSPPTVPVTPASQGLTLTNAVNRWYFTVYGNDLIGANGVDPLQVSTSGSNFTALGGSPPIFSIIEATDFSLFGIVPLSNQVYFTLNDTLWTPSIATETGTFFLTSTPGNITACRALRSGVAIYKRNSFFSGYFAGPPFYWQMSKVSSEIGTAGPYSLVATDTNHYFWGVDDFYSFDGNTLARLPNNVRRWFIANMNSNYEPLIAGVYDRSHSQIIWYFSSIHASPTGSLDAYMAFSLLTGKWVHGYLAIDLPVFGAISSGIQGVLPGTSSILGVVDANHDLNVATGTYAGNPGLGPFITTGYLGDKRSNYRITRTRPGFTFLPTAAIPSMNAFATYVEGMALYNLAGPVGLSPQGYFDNVMAARLTQLQLIWQSEAELCDLDIDIAYAGTR